MSWAVSRNITCKKCGFNGVIEAHDTQGYPLDKIFKHLGKDTDGYLHFECPSCGADEPYSPYGFTNPFIKIGCLLIIAVVIWLIFKILS